MRFATRQPCPLRTLVKGISPELARIVDRALEIDSSARFSSAEELLEALRQTRKSTQRTEIREDEIAPFVSPPADVEAVFLRRRSLRRS